MVIVNRVPKLLREKFVRDGKELNLSTVQTETGLSYPTIVSWSKGRATRFDVEILNTWCKYLSCGVGDILEYVPDEE